MSSPVHIKMDDKRPVADNLDFYLVSTRSKSKNSRLLEVMKTINPYLAIIFTNTRSQANYVADFLANNGVKAGRIHGDLSPRDRKK